MDNFNGGLCHRFHCILGVCLSIDKQFIYQTKLFVRIKTPIQGIERKNIGQRDQTQLFIVVDIFVMQSKYPFRQMFYVKYNIRILHLNDLKFMLGVNPT